MFHELGLFMSVVAVGAAPQIRYEMYNKALAFFKISALVLESFHYLGISLA